MAGFFSRGIDEKAVIDAIHENLFGKFDPKNVRQLSKALGIKVGDKTVRDHITALYKQHLTGMGRTEEPDINDNTRMVFLAQIMCRDDQEYILGKIPDDQLLRNLSSYCSSKQPEGFAPANYSYSGEAPNLGAKAPLQKNDRGYYVEFNGKKHYVDPTSFSAYSRPNKSMSYAPTRKELEQGLQAAPIDTRIARELQAAKNRANALKSAAASGAASAAGAAGSAAKGFLGYFGLGGVKRKTRKQKKTKKSRKVRKGRKGTSRK